VDDRTYRDAPSGGNFDPGGQATPVPGATLDSSAVWGIGWYGTARVRGPAFPWAGAILVLLGVAFLLHQLAPELDAWGLLTFALGIVLVAAWLMGRSRIALWPGAILLGYGAAVLLLGLGVLSGNGWTTLGVGVGFLAGWFASWVRGGTSTWPLLIAGLFALIGAGQLVAELPELRGLDRYAAPVIVIGLGALLILSGMRRQSRV
jgi:hypothetical protein